MFVAASTLRVQDVEQEVELSSNSNKKPGHLAANPSLQFYQAARYTEAAAAAACAATAAYNQHMARSRDLAVLSVKVQCPAVPFLMRFAAQAAAVYPQFSIMPPFLPSLKMEAVG